MDNNSKVQIKKILVPIDGSECSLYAAKYATRIANATTTPLVLKTTTKEKDQFRKKQFESMAADLITSSDRILIEFTTEG